MFGWVRNLFGGNPVVQRTTAKASQFIQARYENAQDNDENARAWAMSDYLSAKASNSFMVRRKLRMRSRYEVSNNPYLFGINNSNADDFVGAHGPSLQCLLPSDSRNRRIEKSWAEWAAAVGLVEKLRTAKLAKNIDGEGFLVLKRVSDLDTAVQIYPVDIEADQVTTAAPSDLSQLWVDGLTLHPITNRPVSYSILRSHPGDFFFPGMNPLACDTIKAKYVIHWFPKFRPGQVRGVPVFTPSLDLFSELRAYRRATLQKAQISANLTAVLETESPAMDLDEEAESLAAGTKAPIDRGMMTALPANAKLKQFDTGDPGTSYEMFQEKCLSEACRPLGYPLNLALGTSQKFNFSSARLDHINYRAALTVERAECDRVVLEKIFSEWLDEAIMIPGLIPAGINSVADVPHSWYWPGFEPLDVAADAKADHDRLAGGTMTLQQFWASRGQDWKDVLRQLAEERDEIETYGLVFGQPAKVTVAPADAGNPDREIPA